MGLSKCWSALDSDSSSFRVWKYPGSAQYPQFHHQPESSASISCTAASMERINRSRGKCAHELAVEFRRTRSGLDFLQEFPQVHRFVMPCRLASELCLQVA
jgi:hypothetical protein